MTWLIFTMATLAVYRIADVLSEEEGPFAVFAKLRRKVPAKTNAGRGVRCPYCLGVWISSIITAYLWWRGFVPSWLSPIYGFGLSGGAAALKKLTP